MAVLEGLEAGDRVVLEGIDRLREGAKVEIVEHDGDIDGEDAQDDGHDA